MSYRSNDASMYFRDDKLESSPLLDFVVRKSTIIFKILLRKDDSILKIFQAFPAHNLCNEFPNGFIRIDVHNKCFSCYPFDKDLHIYFNYFIIKIYLNKLNGLDLLTLVVGCNSRRPNISLANNFIKKL